MFILKLGSELQNLVKKFAVQYENINKFPWCGIFSWSGMHRGLLQLYLFFLSLIYFFSKYCGIKLYFAQGSWLASIATFFTQVQHVEPVYLMEGPIKSPFSVCLAGYLLVSLCISLAFFPGMGHKGFMIVCTMVDNWII